MARRRDRLEPATPWSRQRMLALLVGAGLVTLLLVAGLVLAVVSALHPPDRRTSRRDTTLTPTPLTVRPGTAAPNDDQSPLLAAEEELAARPMPTADQTASEPGPVSTRDPGVPIVVPSATSTGPVGVPSGYPHTPEGALAQMAAIDQTALQSGSLAGARAVITGWAMLGGPTASSWSGVAALAQFFDAAGLSGGGSPQLALVVTPLMGLIKGSVGSDFVIPCVDFELDATLAQTARVGAADCERMVWSADPAALSGGRWMVGPGAEPADPPSVWPDTDTAINAGYRDLSHG